MKLRSLRVNQLKMFMEPHCIGDIGDSLNVVAGPNEIGKSTVFDALRAALFETHSASGKWIRALQNDRSQGAPQVELVFECDEGTYVLTKKFLSAPLAGIDGHMGRALGQARGFHIESGTFRIGTCHSKRHSPVRSHRNNWWETGPGAPTHDDGAAQQCPYTYAPA